MDYSPLIPRSESPIEMSNQSSIFGSVLEQDIYDISNYLESEEENKQKKNRKKQLQSDNKKSKVAMDSQQQQNNFPKGKLFGRSLSKSKSVSEESPYIEDVIFMGKKSDGGGKKSSSPIEIKGSPGKNRDGMDNKGSSTGESNHSSSRISFFKVLTRRNSSTNQGKHKKLQEHWMQAREPIMDGITFGVKFLGSTLIEKTGASDAAEATKTVIQMVKAGHKPSASRLSLTVCTNGITLADTTTGEIRLEISIYDIAHCSSADANHPNVFSFIATNKNDVNECYCFATSKRKMAQHITLTIAQAFNLAFELWQSSSLENSHNAEDQEDDYASKVIIGSTDSAKSCSSTGSTGSNGDGGFQNVIVNNHNPSQWVHFDQEEKGVEDITSQLNSIRMVTLSPFHRNNVSSRRTIKPKNSLLDEENPEDLLICLN